ncbi:flagellar biosynthesis anti-sigma factor FlgM [Craterilacuibacter sp.]|uniref:flagellar biosynthesis anti-sigma factor FlgM n=1 Tax=Craterilacuibacter sp. TaxID=2870909 RepID=UPI003F2DDF18
MKIDSSSKALAAYSAQPRPAKPENSAAAGKSRPAGESVAINPLASQLQAAEKAAKSEPAFDAAKVESIRNAISSGQYQIKPEAIADSLISSAQELLARE